MSSRRSPAWTAVLALALGLVVVRSLVFLLFEQSFFDGDQATCGIMALQLSRAQAFPLFIYGMSYLLAVSVWPAALCIALLGPGVLALKLPLLVINLAVAVLLLRGLVRDAGLSPREAFCAVLPFSAAPVVAASQLVNHLGGTVEPFLWILLVWVLRRRPLLLGLTAGIGYLNRPFTLYGIAAGVAIWLIDRLREPRSAWPRRLREAAVRTAVAAAAFAAVLVTVSLLRPLSTGVGEWDRGYGLARLMDWPGVKNRGLGLTRTMLPALAGGESGHAFGVLTRSVTGSSWAAWLMLLVCLLAAGVTVAGGRRWQWERLRFPLFLVLSSTGCLLAYVAIAVGGGAPAYVRYVLLGLLLPVGLLAAAFTVARGTARLALASAALLWATLSLAGHGRLLHEYLTRTPPDDIRELVSFLEGRQFECGLADYNVAHEVSYLSGERVRLCGRGVTRVLAYRDLLLTHGDRGVGVVASSRCRGGTRVAGWCVVNPPAPLHYRDAVARAGGTPGSE